MIAIIRKNMEEDETEWKIVENITLYGVALNEPYGRERTYEDEIEMYGLYEEVSVMVDEPKITDCFNKAVELIEAFIEAEK